MPADLIQDEAEVVRWFAEGRTYAWMAQEYERQYNLAVVPSTFADVRRRRGLTRRLIGDDDLIPWAVEEGHRWALDLALLRLEARKRAGAPLSEGDTVRLASWHKRLGECDVVLHYDPDTADGFSYVPRRPGIDLDVIREPERRTTRRRAVD